MSNEQMTYEELVTENEALAKRNSELELRLTAAIVTQSRKEEHIRETARQVERRQLKVRFDLHWRVALGQAKRPLDGLIYRAENLPDRPKKNQITDLRAAAVEAREVLAEASREVADVKANTA